jgi:hypothetical protein
MHVLPRHSEGSARAQKQGFNGGLTRLPESLLLLLLTGWLLAAFTSPIRAQDASNQRVVLPQPGPLPTETPVDNPAELAAEINKVKAYTALLDRTERAVQSLKRYDSWVDMKKGPTGRERYIDYGLYEPYDVRSEVDAAIAAALSSSPRRKLDHMVMLYIAAYNGLAPALAGASRYYERKDYKRDQLAEGKAFHKRIVLGADAFLNERKALEEQLLLARQMIGARELASIEQNEGQTMHWRLRKLLIAADQLLAITPTDIGSPLDAALFSEKLQSYALEVQSFEAMLRDDPDAAKIINSAPGDLLSQMRTLEDQIRASNDGRLRGVEAEIALAQVHSFHDMLKAQVDAEMMMPALPK